MRDTGTQGHPGRLRHELMIAKKGSVRGTQRKFTNRDSLLKRVAWQIDKVSPIRKQVRPALGLKTTEKKKNENPVKRQEFRYAPLAGFLLLSVSSSLEATDSTPNPKC